VVARRASKITDPSRGGMQDIAIHRAAVKRLTGKLWTGGGIQNTVDGLPISSTWFFTKIIHKQWVLVYPFRLTP
jgi:hypothetical protein